MCQGDQRTTAFTFVRDQREQSLTLNLYPNVVTKLQHTDPKSSRLKPSETGYACQRAGPSLDPTSVLKCLTVFMSKRFLETLNEFDPEALSSGQVLRALRKGLELTLKDVEKITGLKEQNLSALENDRMDMTVHYAEILAAALGVHPTEILFPNGKWEKSAQISAIERKARKIVEKKRRA